MSQFEFVSCRNFTLNPFLLKIKKSLYAQWRYFLAKNQYLSYKNFDIVAFWDFEKPNSSPTP
ncbi:MAG: hypothetical protein LBE65_01550, partial [Synergistaceae bacterium]|nr:hypothetical protein [Synergistaceae bacterium]